MLSKNRKRESHFWQDARRWEETELHQLFSPIARSSTATEPRLRGVNTVHIDNDKADGIADGIWDGDWCGLRNCIRSNAGIVGYSI